MKSLLISAAIMATTSIAIAAPETSPTQLISKDDVTAAFLKETFEVKKTSAGSFQKLSPQDIQAALPTAEGLFDFGMLATQLSYWSDQYGKIPSVGAYEEHASRDLYFVLQKLLLSPSLQTFQANNNEYKFDTEKTNQFRPLYFSDDRALLGKLVDDLSAKLHHNRADLFTTLKPYQPGESSYLDQAPNPTTVKRFYAYELFNNPNLTDKASAWAAKVTQEAQEEGSTNYPYPQYFGDFVNLSIIWGGIDPIPLYDCKYQPENIDGCSISFLKIMIGSLQTFISSKSPLLPAGTKIQGSTDPETVWRIIKGSN